MQLKRSHACALAIAIRLAQLRQGEWAPTRELRSLFPVRQAYIVEVIRLLIVAGIVKRHERELVGCALARHAAKISLLQIVEAIEGPLAKSLPAEIVKLPNGAGGRIAVAVESGVSSLRKRLASVTLASLSCAKSA